MPSEATRGFKRIAANYARLISTLVLGVAIVPLLIGWIGFEGFGLVSIVGVSVGLAGVVRELISQSMVREIGAAYHTGDEQEFARFYNSAYVVAGAAAAITAAVFGAILLFVHLLNIPEPWLGPARWFIAAQGTYVVLLVMLSPAFSMYRVKEQFGWDAAWNVGIRATGLLSVLVLGYGLRITDIADGIRLHGLLSSTLMCIVLVVAVIVVIARDRRLWPRPSHVRFNVVRQVFHTFSWNSAANVGANLYRIFAAFLMNLAFGVYGNAVFEVAHRLVSYVRMTASGVTAGLEATSVRLSSGERTGGVSRLLRHSSRLQGLVALPAALSVFVLAGPLLELWIGRSLENPEVAIPAALVIARILIVAVTVRAISDGWVLILYGAGHVRRYAPLIFAGGLLSPVLGGLLLWLLPGDLRFNAPAAGYAVVMTIVHFLLLPRIAARCVDLRYPDMYAPLLRPAVTTAITAPLLIVPAIILQEWSLLTLATACAVFALAYAFVAWIIVLTPEERERFGGAARRRLAPRKS